MICNSAEESRFFSDVEFFVAAPRSGVNGAACGQRGRKLKSWDFCRVRLMFDLNQINCQYSSTLGEDYGKLIGDRTKMFFRGKKENEKLAEIPVRWKASPYGRRDFVVDESSSVGRFTVSYAVPMDFANCFLNNS
jgi:hypothetical protein